MPPREQLFRQWQEVGQAHHWSTKELGWLLDAPIPPRDLQRSAGEASAAALTALTHSDSHFCARQLVQALAEEAQGQGLDADAVLQLQAKLLTSCQVVPLQMVFLERRWTTPEMLAMERHVLCVAEAMQRSDSPLPKSDKMVAEILRDHPQLSDEQKNALRHVTCASHGIRVVSGMAGTGKSTLFKAARDVWRKQGRQVYGACLAGKAAHELGEAARMPVRTIHRLLNELDWGILRLNANAVLLVDEAGMVGTRQMKSILDHCHRMAVSLVLCGDVRQLQAIEAGGVFRELSERYGTATLHDIKRQRELWAREAVRLLADGRTAEALHEFSSRGLVSLSDDPQAAMKRLLADWKKEAMAAPDSIVILANRNSDVIEINQLAQRERMHAGKLGITPIVVGQSLFFREDRVVFTRNCPALGVFNGQVGTVAAIDDRFVGVRLDSGDQVSFSPGRYPHLQLAYALTTHKAQGITVERAFVYVDETAENREAAYVQASRARGLCSFYGVGENLQALEPPMARSRPKVLATNLLEPMSEAPSLGLALAY